jgi:hypothetical protein
MKRADLKKNYPHYYNKEVRIMDQKAIKTVLMAGVLLCAVVAQPVRAIDGFLTGIKPYVVPVGGDYQIKPLLSVGDAVPETSNPLLQYQMVGIPDGLGAHGNADGTVTLFMNHEMRNTVFSEPVLGGPLNRGALVSKYILSEDGSVLSGARV